jgi:transposase
MDVTLLQQRLRRSEERNEALGREVASLRATLERVLAEFGTLRHDYETLVDATRIITSERDALRQRVAELEVANNRLVDMLWGRRSERRSDSPDQRHLDFGDQSADLPGAEEQKIITAEAQADEAVDRELLRRLEARRKARREKARRNEALPAHLERRERLLDLPEEQKQGLNCIGVKVIERLRFEKPYVYVEVIKRPQYVTPGQPAEGVRSMPPPLAIVEGSKYDFSVVAAMATLKFAFHLPTYRQQDWFAQCGWFPSRSTVNDLLNYAVATSAPLYREMWRLLLAEPILLGDDTTLPVLLRGALREEDVAKLGKRNRFRQMLDAGLPTDARLLRKRPS